MMALVRTVTLALAILAVVAIGRPATSPAADPGGAKQALRGACYCRMPDALLCTAGLTEQECQRHCDEGLCDDWFWKERLPCWNWGYGG